MSRKGSIFFVSVLLLFNNFFAMKKANKSEDNWAVIISRSCEWCGVKVPDVPKMIIIESVKESSVKIGSYFRTGIKLNDYCVHSTIGPFRALNSSFISTCKNRNGCESVVEDRWSGNSSFESCLSLKESTQTRSLGSSAFSDEIIAFFNPQKCLFTGSNLLVGNARFDKSIVFELKKFFSMIINHQFDVLNVINKRWPEIFFADILCRSSINKEISEILVSASTSSDKPVVFAVSDDGVFGAIGCKGKEDNLFLWRNDTKKMVPCVGHTDSIAHVVFSKNNNVMVSASTGLVNNCIVWDSEHEKLKQNINSAGAIISALAVSKNGDCLVLVTGTDGRNKKLTLFDIENNSVIASIDGDFPELQSLEIDGNEKLIIGKIGGVGEPYVLLWLINAKDKKLQPIVNYGKISAVGYSSACDLMVIANYNADIYMFDCLNCMKEPLAETSGYGIIRAISFDPKDRYILIGSVYSDATVFSCSNFCDTKDFFLIPSIASACATEFTSISFNSTGDKLLLGTSNSFILGEWIRQRRKLLK